MKCSSKMSIGYILTVLLFSFIATRGCGMTAIMRARAHAFVCARTFEAPRTKILHHMHSILNTPMQTHTSTHAPCTINIFLGKHSLAQN